MGEWWFDYLGIIAVQVILPGQGFYVLEVDRAHRELEISSLVVWERLIASCDSIREISRLPPVFVEASQGLELLFVFRVMEQFMLEAVILSSFFSQAGS